MSFWNDPLGAVTGEFNHIAKSVEGEGNTIRHDVGADLSKARAGLGHFYAYVARPAIPIIATVGAFVVPGLQVALPYLLSYDTGAYGHALATQGISGLENVNSRGNIEAGLITTATYGGLQLLGYGASGPLNASSGMNSTQVTEGLENSSFDPLTQTPLEVAESGINDIYQTGKSLFGLAESGIGLAGSGLSAYNSLRSSAGQKPVNIEGQIGYTPGTAQKGTQQQNVSGQSENPSFAGGGFGKENNGNDNLAWTVAIALGVAALAG